MHSFTQDDTHAGVTQWRHPGNGLTVLTAPTPVAPVAGFAVVYRVGSRHEVAGHTGATHMLEHLMFKGSESFNAASGTEIARSLHRVGASFNATTWLDRTSYFEVLPVEHLPLAVAIESDRMRRALIRDEDLASERSVILNELDTGENEPVDLLMKASFAHAYLEHPYHHPTIGWRGDVEQISGEVLRGFYDTYYHPDNATVIVVGDIDPAAALEIVEHGFGGIPPAPAPVPRRRVREGRQRGERRFVLERSGELGSLALTWHIPEGLHADLPALNILAQALSDGVTSRLYQKLVESNRCLGVHAFTFELHDPGVLQIFATLSPEVDHGSVEEAIRDEIGAVRSSPPAVDELARAVTQFRTELAFNHTSPAQIMSGLTEAVAMGDWRRFTRELEAASAVTADDLRRVAGEYLVDRNLTVGWFVPDTDGGNGAGNQASSLKPQAPSLKPHARESGRAPAPRPCYLRRPFAERVELRPLPGGGRLAVIANPHAPTVTMAGTIRAGIASADDGRYAVPSLTAAMLDRGTTSHDRLALARELEDHGLLLAVRTLSSAPATVSVSAQGLAEELPRLAALLTEVLRFPVFPDAELERLRLRVLGALQRERQDTAALAYSALTRRLYPAGHPLHKRRVEARAAELESVTCDELADFHERAYGPRSLVLAVVGDVEADAVAEVLAGGMEGWQGGAAGDSVFEPGSPPSLGDARIHVVDKPNLDVFLGHAGRLRRGDDDEAAALLANSCLGQSTLTSRLGVTVRDEAGLSYSVYSRFFGTLEIPGPWSVSCSVAAGNLDRAVDLCRRVITDYVAEGPDETELADEQGAQAGSYQVGLATNGGIARELVTILTAGEPVSRMDSYPDRIRATTRDEVVEALRKHIRPEELTLAVAGSLPKGECR